MALVNSLQPIAIGGPSAMDPGKTGPQISSKPLLSASGRDKQALSDILELLNRLFARNRNQHRRNHWFKSLHQFRKQLGMLVDELETTKKSALAEKIELRLRFWDQKCIHQLYL